MLGKLSNRIDGMLLPTAYGVWGGGGEVMFSQACVILLTEGGVHPGSAPGFSQGGAPTLQGGGGANIRFCQIFPKTA